MPVRYLGQGHIDHCIKKVFMLRTVILSAVTAGIFQIVALTIILTCE